MPPSATYLAKVQALIQPDVSLVVREHYGKQRRFVDGHTILNRDAPVREWKLSDKVSPTWLNDVRGWSSIYKPHTIDAAERLMRSMHAAGILLGSERAEDGPFPFGICWIQMRDGKASWARQTADNTYRGALDDYFGFLGNRLYQDGAKFSSSCERYVEHHAPYVVIITDAWLKKLAKRLNAYLQMCKKDERRSG